MQKDVTLSAFELPSHRHLIYDSLGEVKEALRVHFRRVQRFLKMFRNQWIRWTCLSFLFHSVFSGSTSTCSVDESTWRTPGWRILQIFCFLWWNLKDFRLPKGKKINSCLENIFCGFTLRANASIMQILLWNKNNTISSDLDFENLENKHLHIHSQK